MALQQKLPQIPPPTMSTSSSRNHITTSHNDMTQSEISQFYSNKSVLITGATGFIGKVLIEKLLFSCPNLSKVYLLIRSSKGKSPKERVQDMLAKKPFNVRLNKAQIANKIIPIESDLGQPKLGLSFDNIQTLATNVDLIFHVAASVRFEAPLETNMLHNVIATKELLEIASTFKHLKCFVHVSTAYSNCQLNSIGEQVYPLSLPQDGDLANFKVTTEMLDQRPNNYTYTKALAENVVCQYADRINIAIARPSIVTPAIAEPAGGWTDTLNGPVGLSLMGSLGILQKIRVNTEVVFDVVPVDIVTNALLSIGWALSNKKKEFSCSLIPHLQADQSLSANNTPLSDKPEADKAVNVFNLTTGNDNPCSFYDYFSKGRNYALENPSSKALRPILKIPKQKGMNIVSYTLYKIFSHLLFAHIVDTLLTLLGHKKMLVKAVNKMHHANELFDYFTSHQWNFVTNNVKKLIHLQSDQDKKEFLMDVRNINWDQYSHISWMGCRRFILDEDDGTIEYAQLRYKLMCSIYYFVKMVLVVVTTITIRSLINSFLLSSIILLPSCLIIYLL